MEEIIYNETAKKIQKKIAMLANYNKERPKELYITEKDLLKLNGINEIDGVKLKIKPLKEKKDMINCFAYIEESHTCYALNHLYCKDEPYCKFYKSKNEYSIAEAERAIRKYSNQ